MWDAFAACGGWSSSPCTPLSGWHAVRDDARVGSRDVRVANPITRSVMCVLVVSRIETVVRAVEMGLLVAVVCVLGVVTPVLVELIDSWLPVVSKVPSLEHVLL